jgi:hypothetical protein
VEPAGVALGQFIGDLTCAVGRGVVYDEDLQAIDVLSQEVGRNSRQVIRFIVGGDDYDRLQLG